MDDPERTFAASEFLRLEVLPKARFHQNKDETDFYDEFFESVERWASPDRDLIGVALRVATNAGLAALDALHVAAALAVGADELITTERPGKPIHRVREISIRTIHEPRS